MRSSFLSVQLVSLNQSTYSSIKKVSSDKLSAGVYYDFRQPIGRPNHMD